MSKRFHLLALALAWLLSGCPTDAPDMASNDDLAATDLVPPSPFVERPYTLKVPATYSKAKPAPLLVLLHGYTLDGADQERRFALTKIADDQGILYAIPDGTKDDNGFRFWNATDGCCDQFGKKVDDVAYLKALIQDVKSRYRVDEKRIFLVGHSNGGFMAYRMACDASDVVAGIVSLAGATWKEPTRCMPSAPVAVLQVHGDQDVVIKYGGGHFASNPGDYPSAADTVAQWAKLNACTGTRMDTGQMLDLDDNQTGAETKVERFSNCPTVAVELWTMRGSGHFPGLGATWGEQILKFLLANPKK